MLCRAGDNVQMALRGRISPHASLDAVVGLKHVCPMYLII